MKPPVSSFTEAYRKSLNSLWALIPGARAPAPTEEVVRKEEQKVANQEWEDEGGTVKPAPVKPETDPVPKIPF